MTTPMKREDFIRLVEITLVLNEGGIESLMEHFDEEQYKGTPLEMIASEFLPLYHQFEMYLQEIISTEFEVDGEKVSAEKEAEDSYLNASQKWNL